MGLQVPAGQAIQRQRDPGEVERVVGCQMDRQTDGQMARGEGGSGCILLHKQGYGTGQDRGSQNGSPSGLHQIPVDSARVLSEAVDGEENGT